MKRIGLWLSLVLASLVPAAAQVTVEVSQGQDQFLPGEALRTVVRVINRSGQSLSLGAEDNWLTFSVENRDGGVVPKVSEVPVTGAFVLPSSKTAVKRVDLAPYFSFGQAGRYQVTATVRIPTWSNEVTSDPRYFDIVGGTQLWEQDFGVPPTNGAPQGTPEVRRYILQQANYLKGQLRLYLRVMAASGRPVRVVPIGPMFSVSRPQPRVDSLSNLHVLYQNGASSYSYTVFNPDGKLLTRQTYDYVDLHPRLNVDEEGKVVVAGGVRRETASDYPPSPAPASAETASPNPSAETDAKPASPPDDATTAKP
jgi:hypothetical protein